MPTQHFYCSGRYYYMSSQLVCILKERLRITGVRMKDIPNFARHFGIQIFRGYADGGSRCNYYLEDEINALLSKKENRERVKTYFENLATNSSDKIASEIKSTKKSPDQKKSHNENPKQLTIDFDRQEENRKKMEKIINKYDPVCGGPESDMDYVSNELLKNDEVFYESVKTKSDEDLSDVKTKWTPREGLFLEKDPKRIASYLMRHSKDRAQAMRRLTFYMNRAGGSLKNEKVLNQAKKILEEK